MAKTVSVVVAHVDIVGDVMMEPRFPDLLAVAPGDRLHVKLLFHFAEVSRAHDDFRLELTSEFAGVVADPVTHVHKDRRGLPDDQLGFIMQPYTVPKEPGEHILSFEATAQYTEDGRQERVTITDQIPVRVA